MKRLRGILIGLALTAGLLACSEDGKNPVVSDIDAADRAGKLVVSNQVAGGMGSSRTLASIPVVNFIGTAVGEVRPVPPFGIEGVADEGLCFDIDMVDAATGRHLGRGTDCITVLEAADDGIKLIGTAYFEFPQGTIVTRGLTSVRPTIPDHGSEPVTHGTTGIPAPGENGVLEATGDFAGLEASVRLGGAVNLSNLASANEMTFDCLFVIRPL
ncbi:MAG: hypothetical protein GKR89_17855 [Candidatus Latescibacteria bacterium]|nr:hypothetical protein [Candidatus Latescibacterota bacterium]